MLFINNKYTCWYNNIIYNAVGRILPETVYTEKHHIIPKCFGGTNVSENLVVLTAKEHFVCHRLLTKMTEGKERSKMCYAVWQMTHIKNRKRYIPSSNVYQILKQQLSETTKNKNYEERYGEERAKEIKRKIGEKSKGRQPMLGKKHSRETKRKISQANSGRPLPKTEETKRRMSETWTKIAPDHNGENNPMYGKVHKAETKKLISAANKGEKNGMFGKYKNAQKIICPHCSKAGKDGPNFLRWHFDNCRSKV
jgi:hypothetical protein